MLDAVYTASIALFFSDGAQLSAREFSSRLPDAVHNITMEWIIAKYG